MVVAADSDQIAAWPCVQETNFSFLPVDDAVVPAMQKKKKKTTRMLCLSLTSWNGLNRDRNQLFLFLFYGKKGKQKIQSFLQEQCLISNVRHYERAAKNHD